MAKSLTSPKSLWQSGSGALREPRLGTFPKAKTPKVKMKIKIKGMPKTNPIVSLKSLMRGVQY